LTHHETSAASRRYPPALALPLAAAMLFSAGCMVGPNYKRPAAPVPPAFKELPPSGAQDGWKEATPSDALIKGKWWEIYNDPALNALEEQVAIDNQNVLLAEANYREAKAAVRVARSALFPSITTGPSLTEQRSASTLSTYTSYNLPVDASWSPDLWGSIRRSVTASSETAQASAAQLENARLLYQATLAEDYFSLHGLDSEYELLDRTAKSYEEYLTLTRNRYAGGVASDLDVAQAESQLYATQTSLQDLGVARAQYEHAIAVLTGRPPAALNIPALVLKTPPPPIPVALPSTLLERRPDIAVAERQMAAANEQIGIATAAYYPTLNLAGAVGLAASNFTSWPARFFSVGPSVAETIFDAGRRRGQLVEAQAAFDAIIATYRQTVLTAFQQVEDELAALRILAGEATTVEKSVSSSERALTLSTAQYKAGTTDYLTVITAQATALNAEITAVNLLTRRIVASVTLVQALGGGWDASELPTVKDVQAKSNTGN
jgi:NodT family efflux transporter outer membrane factor (OMF) lipoprotein